MMPRYIRLLVLLVFTLAFIPTMGHIGSPGVVYEGKAGPYYLLVNISPPDVIPGVAEISIYSTDTDIEKIQVKPIYWGYGDEGSPKSDPMLPVEGMPGQYAGEVWFMDVGTASIAVYVDGERGEGETIVPIMASATATRDMEPTLGWILAALGLLLVVLMITIVSAAVGEGVLTPGSHVKNLKRKKIIGATVAACVISLVLYGGKSWWDSETNTYLKYMYKPPLADSWIAEEEGKHMLTFQIDSLSIKNKDRLSMKYLVPDHGKLMHMFMIREGSLDVFAHLHPKRVDPLTFKVYLPDLPPGRYYVFGDIVRLNGYTETIADTVEVPAKALVQTVANTISLSDPDDTFIISTAVNQAPADYVLDKNILVCGKPGVETPLLDGSTAVFDYQVGKAFEVDKVYPLTFAINDPQGEPAELEPYMGMMGHAVIFRKEGGVYNHLHPVGNYSMTSQQILESRIAEDSPRPEIPEAESFYDSINQVVYQLAQLTESERSDILMAGMDHTGLGVHAEHGSTVTFPYAFPIPGDYRIWIQMKRNGQVLNSSFDAKVE